MNENLLRTIQNLPEELEFTETQWYEYYFYLKRNAFLLQKILEIPRKPERLYLVEPQDNYLGPVLRSYGFQVDCDHEYRLHSSDRSLCPSGEKSKEGYDLILLLNVIEHRPEPPQLFLAEVSSLLGKNGRVLIVSENIAQFKNRLRLLFGRSIFAHEPGNEMKNYRRLGQRDLQEVCSAVGLSVLDSRLICVYPPYRMEPLTLKRYLSKYANYFVMKHIPGFRDTLFIAAKKEGAE